MNSIPAALRDRARWLGWRLVNDKKVPHSIKTGLPCDATDPANWVPYDEAAAASTFGLGIALGDGLAGVDLDDCRNPEAGDLTPEARAIIDALHSFTEVSPSGTGVKVFLTIDWPPASLDGLIENKRRTGLEIYVAGRFFTVTGAHVPGTPDTVEHRDRELRALIAREFGARTVKTSSWIPDRIPQGTRDDTATSMAGKLRRQGFTESEIRGALAGSTRFDPPLEAKDIARIAHSVARYAPAADPHPRTETGDAEFFAEMHAGSVRFDHRRGRWLVFGRHFWAPPTDGAVYRLARDAVRVRFDLARKDDDKDRMAWALAGESRKRQVNLLALAQNFPPVADRGDGWDADPFLLGCSNGIIDLRTGALRAGTPDDRVTMTAHAPYDPKAACPLFVKTISEIFGDDEDLIAYVQRALGNSLTGDCREECLFVCWGDGANGKSTLLNTVGWLLDAYADDLPASALQLLKHRSEYGNDVAKLDGKRFVTAAEPNGMVLDDTRVKRLTGRDPITARFLYREFFTFEPTFKLWLATNVKPTIGGDDPALWRRIHLIPFTQSFLGRENRGLKDALRAEGAGILRWLVEGCSAWQAKGLQPPDTVKAATDAWRRESGSLPRFLDARCVTGNDKRVRAGELYRAYEQWCRLADVPESQALTQTAFGKKVKARFDSQETGHVTCYYGVGLISPEF